MFPKDKQCLRQAIVSVRKVCPPLKSLASGPISESSSRSKSLNGVFVKRSIRAIVDSPSSHTKSFNISNQQVLTQLMRMFTHIERYVTMRNLSTLAFGHQQEPNMEKSAAFNSGSLGSLGKRLKYHMSEVIPLPFESSYLSSLSSISWRILSTFALTLCGQLWKIGDRSGIWIF